MFEALGSVYRQDLDILNSVATVKVVTGCYFRYFLRCVCAFGSPVLLIFLATQSIVSAVKLF